MGTSSSIGTPRPGGEVRGSEPTVPRRWGWICVVAGLLVWLLALVVAAVLGARSGAGPPDDGSTGSAQVPSEAQRSLIDEHGPPTVFLVADGVGAVETGLTVRLEWWSYPEVGLTVAFLDGEPIARSTATPATETGAQPSSGGPAGTVDPTRLVHGMDASQLTALLGPPGLVTPAPTAAYPQHQVVVYPQHGIAVSTIDGVLVSAQTLREVGP